MPVYLNWKLLVYVKKLSLMNAGILQRDFFFSIREIFEAIKSILNTKPYPYQVIFWKMDLKL